MSSISTDSIRTLCHARVADPTTLRLGLGRFDERVAHVVEENIASGRFSRFAAGASESTKLAEYVDRVVSCLTREWTRLQALEDGDSEEWNRLCGFLHHRALRMVQRFRKGGDAWSESLDFAQQACVIIFEERYPCDVAFEAWATTILSHLVTARYTRSRDVLNRRHPPDSLEEPLSTTQDASPFLGDRLSNPASLNPFERVEHQLLLLDAIDRLRSTAQRQVILASFMEELDDAEIAARLRKSKQAVYNLRQRALAELKEILRLGFSDGE